MRIIYYYVHTGHRFGLNRFRKAVAILEAVPELEITLLTSDYRIASASRDFGVKRAVGIDVLRNIANVTEHGDILIYDSTEHHEQQLHDMIDYFSAFIRVSDNPEEKPVEKEFMINPYLESSEKVCNAIPVSESFIGDFEKSIETTLFFGDDDYDKRLLEANLKSKYDLLLGFYFFMGYEDELNEKFGNIYESEEYDDIVRSSKNLITSSTQTALNSLASGGKPIFVERDDRDSNGVNLLKRYGVPTLENFENVDEVLKSERDYKSFENSNSELRDFLLKIAKGV
jgi:hypothetical protein